MNPKTGQEADWITCWRKLTAVDPLIVSGSGRPRTARGIGNVTVVEEMALSQEDKPRTHRTVRQIARESGIPRSSIHRIIKTDLQLKCLKKSNAQSLTLANKQARMIDTG